MPTTPVSQPLQSTTNKAWFVVHISDGTTFRIIAHNDDANSRHILSEILNIVGANNSATTRIIEDASNAQNVKGMQGSVLLTVDDPTPTQPGMQQSTPGNAQDDNDYDRAMGII